MLSGSAAFSASPTKDPTLYVFLHYFKERGLRKKVIFNFYYFLI